MLSYSCLTNYGKTTLPSVESWGTDMDILRDPPKSIHTRRINKVGQDSTITATIDEATDRAAEAILQYPRGQNPMVSVQYNNNNKAGSNLVSSNSQAFLPYRVMRDGVFRPPIQSQYDLQPLSRQPRVWTSNFTNPGFVDFSKKLIVESSAEKSREIKKAMLKTNIRPTTVYVIETPIEKPNETKYMVHSELTHKEVGTNLQKIQHVNNNDLQTLRYLQNPNTSECHTNVNLSKFDFIDEMVDKNQIQVIENPLKADANTNMKGDYSQVSYIHDNLELDKNIPLHFIDSNMSDSRYDKKIEHENTIDLSLNKPNAMNVYSNMNGGGNYDTINSREAFLMKKINPGEFYTKGNMPSIQRVNPNNLYESQKTKLSKKASSQFFGRYGN